MAETDLELMRARTLARQRQLAMRSSIRQPIVPAQADASTQGQVPIPNYSQPPVPADGYVDPNTPMTLSPMPAQTGVASAYQQGVMPGLQSYVTDIGKAAAAGLSRGVTGLADLGARVTPQGVAESVIRQGQAMMNGGGPVQMLTAALPTGVATQEASRLTNGASDFRGETMPGQFVGTAMEFLPGGVAAKAPMAAGIVPGLVSEAAGQYAEGDPLWEPLARLAGAVAGGGIAGIPKGLSNLIQSAAARPTIEALKAVKNAAYQLVDNSGVTFSGADMRALSDRVRAAFTDSHYVPETDDASRATLAVLGSRADQPTTLSQLDSVRQNLWSRYSKALDQPRILDAIHAIDGLVETTAAGSAVMEAARAANAQFAKTQLLENAFQRAADVTAATGSGGNIVNKYRQAVASIINNPREMRFFSQPEIDVMRSFVRGTDAENWARRIGKLSPSGNGLMMALHIIGGVASSGMTVPLMAVGSGAKAIADSGVMRNAERLMDMTSGARSPASLMPSAQTRPIIPIGAFNALSGQ